MAKRSSGRRYAGAVFEIALESNKLDEWQAGLDKLAGLARDKTIAAFMESPGVAFKDKSRVLKEALNTTDPAMQNFLHLLISRGKLGMVGEIAADYRGLLDEQRNIARAEVITAVPLDEKETKKVVDRLGEMLGKKVVAQNEVDPELIGGMVVRVGGKLLDGSTRGRLEALRTEIIG